MQAISLWNHYQIVSNYCPSYFYSLRNCFTFRFIQKNSFSYLMPQQEAYNVDWLVSSSVVNCLTYHMAGVIWQRSKWNQLPNIASYDFFQLQPISQTYPPPCFYESGVLKMRLATQAWQCFDNIRNPPLVPQIRRKLTGYFETNVNISSA